MKLQTLAGFTRIGVGWALAVLAAGVAPPSLAALGGAAGMPDIAAADFDRALLESAAPPFPGGALPSESPQTGGALPSELPQTGAHAPFFQTGEFSTESAAPSVFQTGGQTAAPLLFPSGGLQTAAPQTDSPAAGRLPVREDILAYFIVVQIIRPDGSGSGTTENLANLTHRPFLAPGQQRNTFREIYNTALTPARIAEGWRIMGAGLNRCMVYAGGADSSAIFNGPNLLTSYVNGYGPQGDVSNAALLEAANNFVDNCVAVEGGGGTDAEKRARCSNFNGGSRLPEFTGSSHTRVRIYCQSPELDIVDRCPAGEQQQPLPDIAAGLLHGQISDDIIGTGCGPLSPCPPGSGTVRDDTGNCVACPAGATIVTHNGVERCACTQQDFYIVGGNADTGGGGACQACPADRHISMADAASNTGDNAGISNDGITCVSAAQARCTRGDEVLYLPVSDTAITPRNATCVRCASGQSRDRADKAGGQGNYCSASCQNPTEYLDPADGFCKACPAGSNSRVVSNACTCDDPDWRQDGAGSCTQCATGMRSDPTNTFCIPGCPAGTTRSGNSCVCPGNEIFVGGVCESCEAPAFGGPGFTKVSGANICECAGNKYIDGTGACVACPAGSNKVANENRCQCTSGIMNADHTACTACPTNRSPNSTATQCRCNPIGGRDHYLFQGDQFGMGGICTPCPTSPAVPARRNGFSYAHPTWINLCQCTAPLENSDRAAGRTTRYDERGYYFSPGVGEDADGNLIETSAGQCVRCPVNHFVYRSTDMNAPDEAFYNIDGDLRHVSCRERHSTDTYRHHNGRSPSAGQDTDGRGSGISVRRIRDEFPIGAVRGAVGVPSVPVPPRGYPPSNPPLGRAPINPPLPPGYPPGAPPPATHRHPSEASMCF